MITETRFHCIPTGFPRIHDREGRLFDFKAKRVGAYSGEGTD